MIWFLYLPFMILCLLFYYVTIPIVILFADEVGQLPPFWKNWQTWDDCLDSKFFMTEVVPRKYKFLDYNCKMKYRSYQDTVTLRKYGHWIEKVALLENVNWNFKELVQRYFCRLLWSWRNPAYGFAFWNFGIEGKISDFKFLINKFSDKDHELQFGWSENISIWKRPWTLRFYQHIFGSFYLTGYLGWKIPFWHEKDFYRCMMVYRIVPRFKANN